jgi:pimeloyl-ACP methyl ester carboxylesterase
MSSASPSPRGGARPPRRGRRAALAALGAALALALAGLAVAWSRFSSTLAAARRRVSGRSEVVATRFGRLEYAVAGRGPPLLMLHGTGGGFDQGLAMPGGLAERGVTVIAPSRFGYLRSDFPADPSSENQADALVELLDRLGVRRVVVAGGSAGALSAMQFALRHPDRCAGLVLVVPAANVRGRDPVSMSPAVEWAVRRLLESDALFWLALRTMPETLIGTLLATDPALLAQVSPEERRRAYAILEGLMPIAPRARGMLNDARLAGRPAPVEVERIAMPALLLSVEDDRFGTAATARDLAARMPDARLVVYPSGGHVWLGHDAEVADEVARFVRQVSG